MPQIVRDAQMKADPPKKVLLWGKPKEAGKSTLAMHAPTPIIGMQFDLGMPTIPPGVENPDGFIKVDVPPIVDMDPATSAWSRPVTVATDMMKDAKDMRNGIMSGKKEFEFSGEKIPRPKTIIVDGMVELAAHALDWWLAVNEKSDPEDLKNRYAAWGGRLKVLRTFYSVMLALPVNVVFITWEHEETKEAANGQIVGTGVYTPNLGGQLDIQGPGKVDCSVHCFHELITKQNSDGQSSLTHAWRARIKPNPQYPSVGIRNRYDAVGVVDVTLNPEKPYNPWEKLWGKG